MAALSDAADRLEAATRAMAELEPEIEGLGPWSLAERFGSEPEASWGPPEVLAHVSEMLPYWLGEIERIVGADAGADPVPFGRVSGDEVRVAIIGRDRTIPIRELVARISADGRRVARRLRELDAAGESGRTGLHPRLGEMTLPDIGERFLATHASEHVLQLQEILAAAAG
ncbi:MAG TPA: hypothetical protein VJ506_06350 [Candidatus Limnocylindrales bacterium]|nr:hypothetical protein [Candidatus Limnocylindrales bacterium]